MISPIFIHMAAAKALLSEDIILAAQNVSPFANGAFTGEISATQLKDFSVNWVIIGHSERRNYFRESDEVTS